MQPLAASSRELRDFLPARPLVMQPMGSTRTRASRPTRSMSASTIVAESGAGFVFGIAQTVVNPPRSAAARLGRNRALVLEAWLAQVRVQVDEARAPRCTRGRQSRGRPRPDVLAAIGSTSPSRRSTSSRTSMFARRVDHAAAANEERSVTPRLAVAMR